jgi:hypothetical protein
LEHLYTDCILRIQQLSELKLLLHGIAAAPSLRTLDRQVGCRDGHDCDVSAREASEMFSNALKECQNNTLECIRIFCVGLYDACKEESWTREVIPILEFNHVRRLSQEIRVVFLTMNGSLEHLVSLKSRAIITCVFGCCAIMLTNFYATWSENVRNRGGVRASANEVTTNSLIVSNYITFTLLYSCCE